MWLFIILVISEILIPVVLHHHIFSKSKPLYYFFVAIHVLMSLWLWSLFFVLTFDNSFYDNPQHVWLMMNMRGMLVAVVFPRFLVIFFHYTGMLIRIKTGEYIKWLTNTGLTLSVAIFSIITAGTLNGRFNFRTEEVTIKIKGLNKDLEGLRIIQLSDMHLAGFYHHMKLLEKVMEQVNTYKPDLILNTGDFITFGWREFDRNDTILLKARSKYGNFAVMGNHDFGTYHRDFTEADKENNVLIMKNLITASGYKVLSDENTIVTIRGAKIGLAGIMTVGRHPDITYGNLAKAIFGLDSVDLRILLSHDPNHWEKAVTGKTNIDITLSGHTHGMQMGIITKNYRWSPSKYFYPHWNGLFKEVEQYQYVNRGLGVLSVPFRICMPPEITIITLQSE